MEERHRHRYEVNPHVVPQMARKGFLFVGMGVDEQNTDIWDVKKRTDSSAELMQMADQTEIDLLHKIDDLCQRGGDGVTRPAVRMEMFEMKGKYKDENSIFKPWQTDSHTETFKF